MSRFFDPSASYVSLKLVWQFVVDVYIVACKQIEQIRPVCFAQKVARHVFVEDVALLLTASNRFKQLIQALRGWNPPAPRLNGNL